LRQGEDIKAPTTTVAPGRLGPVFDDAPAPVVGVGAVIIDSQGRVLLHRRYESNLWAPVSGHVEFGESLYEAVTREIFEETGRTAVEVIPVAVLSDPAIMVIPYRDGRRHHFITTIFRCRLDADTIEGSDEGNAWSWFWPGALPTGLTIYSKTWLETALAAAATVLVR